MGVDTRIILKNHASVEKVYDVLAVVLGAEKTYKSYSNPEDYDITKPSERGNGWCIKVLHNENDKAEYKDFTYFDVQVTDICGNQFNTLYFYDIDDSPDIQNGERMLSPRCSGAWLAIGKKLVDFFGGEMVIADCNDFDDPDNLYKVETPMYSPLMEGGDDRWYAFNNALKALEPLTGKDILEFKDICAYWGDREDSLINHLSKITQHRELQKELNSENIDTKKKMKL